MSLIQDIRAAEQDIARLSATHDEVVKKAEADGVIDEEEKKQIKQIDDQIKVAKDFFASAKKQWEEGKAKWEARKDGWLTAKKELDELKAWQHIPFAEEEKLLAEIQTNVDQEVYSQQPEKLDAVLAKLAPKHEEYMAQSAAKTELDNMRSKLTGQMAIADTYHDKLLAADKDAIMALRMDVHGGEEKFDYVTALAKAKELATKNEDFAAKKAEQDSAKATYDAEASALDPRISSLAAKDPKLDIVANEVAALSAVVADMNGLVTNGDYAGAVSKQTDAKAKCDDAEAKLKAEEDRLAKIKTEVETRRSNLILIVGMISVVETKKFEKEIGELKGKLAELDTARTTEKWDDALKAVNEVDKMANDLLPKVQAIAKVQEDLKSRRSQLDSHLAVITSNDAVPQDKRKAVEDDISAFDRLMKEEDYDGAKIALDSLDGRVKEIEAQLDKKVIYDGRLKALATETNPLFKREEKWAYLLSTQQGMLSALDDARKKAEAGEFGDALAQLDKVAVALAEMERLIEEKKKAYLAAREGYDRSYKEAEDNPIANIANERKAVLDTRAAIDAAAGKEDWAAAAAGIEAAKPAIDAFGKVFEVYRFTGAAAGLPPVELGGGVTTSIRFNYKIVMLSSELDPGEKGRLMAQSVLLDGNSAEIKLPRGAKYSVSMDGQVKLSKGNLFSISGASCEAKITAPLDETRKPVFELNPGKTVIDPPRKGISLVDPTAQWNVTFTPSAAGSETAGGNVSIKVDFVRNFTLGAGAGGVTAGTPSAEPAQRTVNVSITFVKAPNTPKDGG